WRLNDLKREGHICRTRHTRHVTLDFRIQRQAVCRVFLSLLLRPWLVGDLVALDDTLPRGNCANCVKLEEGSRLSNMVLDVPISGTQGLPQTGQVGVAIGYSG